jgi:probable DNA metabolism protein
MLRNFAMIEYAYDGSLEGLFRILDGVRRAADPVAALPGLVRGPIRRIWETRVALSSGGFAPAQPDLFGDCPPAAARGTDPEAPLPGGATFLAAPILTGTVPDIPAARQLRELSANAYDCFIHGWMSESPVETELVRFAWKVLDAGRRSGGGLSVPAARRAAEAAAADRGDADVETALAAAYKVWKELDRLRGLLRFSPGPGGVHIARCAPDHFVLPGLAGHFTIRFGEAAWAIIDERRGLALARGIDAGARLIPLDETPYNSVAVGRGDPWEELWRSYHRVIANESRANQRLQTQFMPRRYWKYLPEAQE